MKYKVGDRVIINQNETNKTFHNKKGTIIEAKGGELVVEFDRKVIMDWGTNYDYCGFPPNCLDPLVKVKKKKTDLGA